MEPLSSVTAEVGGKAGRILLLTTAGSWYQSPGLHVTSLDGLPWSFMFLV